jgi:pimeloyl-ACP methyl ester carboxylesterase
MRVVELSLDLLERDGVELSVRHRSGEPVVLFLHGLAGYGSEWIGVASRLSESVGLVIPDLRGHADSRGSSVYGVGRDDFVGDAVESIEVMAGGGPVIVVGQSMGGIVGTYLASERPDLVSALVLVETGMEAMTQAEIDSLAAWLDRLSDGFVSDDEALAFFGPDTRGARVWVDGLTREGDRLTARFDPEQMVEVMRNLATEPRWPHWANVKADTTLMTASSTALAKTDIDGMLTTSPGTSHVVVADSGHDVHLDQPRAVAKLITRIVERTKGS